MPLEYSELHAASPLLVLATATPYPPATSLVSPHPAPHCTPGSPSPALESCHLKSPTPSFITTAVLISNNEINREALGNIAQASNHTSPSPHLDVSKHLPK